MCGGGVSCGGDDDGENDRHKLIISTVHSLYTAGDVVSRL